MTVAIRDLSAISDTIRREHRLAVDAGRSWVTHAIAAGDALLAAWELVPRGEWTDWAESATGLSKVQSRFYMRVALYRDEVLSSGATNLLEARLAIRGKPARSQKGQLPEDVVSMRAAIEQRHSGGETWQSIADSLGVRVSAIRCLVDEEYRRRFLASKRRSKRKAQRRRTEAARAMRAAERERLIRNAKGDVSAAYSDLRRALSRLDSLMAASQDPAVRLQFRKAMSAAHTAEDAVVEAIRMGA